ncbi:MAG TPA: tetratricopeptide repeat protein [Kofleriaceae bacterium]|nr:tetratricopeptide repeat protein [Kofleriaceae bacterium]
MSEIRALCEAKLGSRALALTWTGRAFDLSPDDAVLLGELLRLAHLPEHWREVSNIIGKHADDTARPSDTRLRLLRALAELYGHKLNDYDAARDVHGKILALTPKDADAAAAYEDLSERLSDWPALLASLRRRLEDVKGPERRALLARIAGLEEQRLADLDDAAATWQLVLADTPDDPGALAALARLHDARGDWSALATVLTRQLAAPGQVDDRRGLLMQLGALEEKNLDRPEPALEHYLAALQLCRVPGPAATVDANARFLDPSHAESVRAELRRDVARALRPHLEHSGEPNLLARCLELIAGGETPGSPSALELDRRLVGLHHGLGRPDKAWDAAARVVAGDPADVDARAALTGLAHELGKTQELATRLNTALAARKSAGAPPAEVRALAAELALLHANNLGDRGGAEKAWIHVLEAEPDDAEAFDELAALYRSASRWDDLRALLERRVAATGDDAARKAALLELAQVDEEILGDPGRAVGDYRRVLEVDPAHVPAYKALERLYADGKAFKELDDILAREVPHVGEKEQVALIFRRAELHALQLNNPAQAVELLEDVVTMQPGHADGRELLEELLSQPAQRQRVARLLEPLYERDRLWKDLCTVLRAQREAAADPEAAVELLARIAGIEETHLENGRQAFDTWVTALAADPSDERPRAALLRLAGTYDRWNDAASAFDKAASSTNDVQVAVPLLRQLAEIADVSLGDNARAVAAYQRLYKVDPADPEVAGPALAALARLFEEDEKWSDLRDTLRRQAEGTPDQDARKALYARVAGLEETRLDDRKQAITTWREVLSQDPDDPDALAALERLYDLGKQWTELGEIVRHQVDLTPDVSVKTAQLFRLVALHEHKRNSPADAVLVLLEILDLDPDDTRALDELARFHKAAGRHIELNDVLERRLAIADALGEPDATARRFEIAQLLAGPLGREMDALERHAEVLEREPSHEGALAAVQRSVDDLNLGGRAAAILEPLYEATGQDQALCALLLTVANREPGVEKVRRLVRVAQIREQRLADKAGALQAVVASLRPAMAEPELPDLLAEVERLASDLGREGDLIDIYRSIADDVMAAELQRRLYLDIADLALAVRDDASLARTFYQKVLDQQPDDRRALTALEGLYRRSGDVKALYEVLGQKVELVDDPTEKLAALSEIGAIASGAVDRPDDAINAWEQVLELDPSRSDAVGALDQLYRRERRWHDVVDLYERRMGFAVGIEEAVALRIRLAEVQENQLEDRTTAVDSYAAALGGDPGNVQALAALERLVGDPSVRAAAAEVLEPIYIARQDWPRLARLNEQQLEASSEPGERLGLTLQIARIYEEQLEDLEGAFKWYARVFREDPTDDSIRDQLQRLAQIVDDWPGLARVYQDLLDDEPGEAPHLREIAMAVGTIYDRRLDLWEPGSKAYRRVLASPGDTGEDQRLFTRLEEMLSRHAQWKVLSDVYDDGITAADDDVRRRDLFARKATIAEGRLNDVDAAIAAWRSMIELAGGSDARGDYERAAAQLDRLLRGAGRWYDVAELLRDRLERATDEREEVEIRLSLAAVLESELKDVTGAIDQYEAILGTHYGESALPDLERLVNMEDAHRERLAGLLEPVYRSRDWWQKLIVILGAKLAYVDDPADKVAIHLEIAGLHDTRGGDPELSFDALSKAWELEPARRDVFDRLCTQGARLGAWNDLVQVLEGGAASTMDPEAGALALARIAEIHETQRGDHESAIAAWKRVLQINGDDPVALSSLDRLYAVEGRAADLVGVVERRADLVEDAGVRLVLLHRIASLYEEVLEKPREAVAAYKNVLNVDDSDEASLDALERLYRQLKEPRDLAQILERKLELARDPASARQLRLDLAVVHEQDLGDAYEAQNQLQAVLSGDQGDQVALAELDRLYQQTRMWPELLEVLDRRAVTSPDPAARAELAYRAAALTEKELVEPDAAIPRYGAVLAMAPSHGGARQALEALLKRDDQVEAVAAILDRHLRSVGDHDALVAVTERRLELPGDPDARLELWNALAEIHETLRGDLKASSATWARALAEDPSNTQLFAPLERLAQARGAWPELAGTLEKRLDAGSGGAIDGELENTYALRLGRIYEDALGDFERAAIAYKRAADTHVDERGSLAALDRVLWRLGRWGELADVLAREADAAENDAQSADLMFRLGDVRESQLHDLAGAVDAYRLVVERQSRHGAARASLERLLTTAEAERSTIIDTLEPLYESEGDWARLADLLAAKLSVTADHHERAAIYQRIAALSETRLGDGLRALDAAGGWLAEDPTSGEALGELDRLAATQGRWHEVAARVQGVAQHADEVALPLWIYLGTVQLDRLGDAPGAAASFNAALAIDDEHAPALEALERIHRSHGDVAALAQVQARRADLAFDPPRKQALWTEVADLRERLGDTDGAIVAWEHVIDIADDDRMPLGRLAAIFERQGDKRNLVTTLGRAARIATDPDEEKSLRVRIAQLESELGDAQAAAQAWQGVLDLDPSDPQALAALEDVHARAGDWMAVQDVLTRKLELARSSSEKTQVLARMARVAEKERNALDDAVGHWYAVLEIDNAQLGAYGELERLLGKAERWHDLVELLERRADLHGTLGDGEAELQALARAADIWEGPLDDPDAAGEILEKILRREPGSVAALTRLAKIHERAGDWEKCSDVLQRALQLGPRGKDAADLFYRLGQVADNSQHDRDTATSHYKQALVHDPSHAASVTALEKLARDAGDWVTVGDMLGRRIAAVESGAAEGDLLALALELADVKRRTGDPAAALPVLERAAASAPGDVRVLAPLADLYFAAGSYDRAGPIYAKLADEARAGRRMKDVARYRQRQGGILEARGDAAGALGAYEEAFRVNPTDVPTMAGLGRLYMAARDWEKARRVYRSLVLQNLGTDSGVTKPDVYLALGNIHVELNERPQAKGMYQRGLEIDSHHPGLKDAIARLA